MCVSNQEFQLVNPTTQVALFSLCLGTCYTNASSSVAQWIPFNQTMNYKIFGFSVEIFYFH
jgi:hypothetical protein